MSDIKALREKVKDLKVLFVEDEEDVRDGTSKFLKKFFINVTTCANGAEGLDIFKKNRDFDVVITDVFMPVMSGVDMCREIRKIDDKVFIIFLTALKTSDKIKTEFSNVVLQKPLSFEDIIPVMDKLTH